MRQSRLIPIFAALLLAASATAHAQADYPSRPIRFLVGVVPGGAADILARALGQKLTERMKQQVIVDNRAGASQTIAAELTAKAPPDGHTILIVPSGHAINPALFKLRYDSVRDFSAIALVAGVPNVLVVHPSIPARSVKEFVAHARAKPGTITFGSSGTGAPSHLAGELFRMMTGVQFTHVPYKGQGQAMIDMLGGNLQMAFPSIPASIQHIKAGRMIALGVTPRRRSAALPEVPTLDEAGVAGYEVNGWYGVLGPARMPRPIVSRLNRELTGTLEEAAFRELLSRQGADPLPSSPEEFSRILAADIVKWEKVVKEAGIKVE